jgi:hypothetical protein
MSFGPKGEDVLKSFTNGIWSNEAKSAGYFCFGSRAINSSKKKGFLVE